MPDQHDTYPGFGKEAPITSIQPGRGWGMSVELAWGRFRRWVLRTCFSSYVKAQLARRQDSCTILKPDEVIDERDLKYFTTLTGYSFTGKNPFEWRRHLPFASWGLAEVVVFTLACMLASTIVGYLAWWGAPPWLVWLLSVIVFLFWLEILWFFRNPHRTIPNDPNAVLCPADGQIVELAEVDAEGFPGGRAFRVGIFLNVFNVHINRAPLAARVTKLRFYPGKFLNAMKTISARVNEQLWIDLEHIPTGMPIRVTQISGALAHRIVCELKPGQELKAGDTFGMIKLGSRTELYLPSDTKFTLKVKVGDKVVGGTTVLMQLS